MVFCRVCGIELECGQPTNRNLCYKHEQEQAEVQKVKDEVTKDHVRKELLKELRGHRGWC